MLNVFTDAPRELLSAVCDAIEKPKPLRS